VNTLKIINVSILAVIVILLSVTALGASSQKPVLENDPQGPYIPKNLPPYEPVYGDGGVVVINMTTNQPISTSQKPIDYIDIYTTKDLQNFVYKAGTNLTIPLYFKLISQTEVTASVTIDPHSPFTLRVTQSLGFNKGEILLNDYMHYNYNGTLDLKNGTLTKVLLTISIPSGLWPYTETTHIPFNLLGIDSMDNHVAIVPRFSGEIDL
jgi:hypothetical protein